MRNHGEISALSLCEIDNKELVSLFKHVPNIYHRGRSQSQGVVLKFGINP